MAEQLIGHDDGVAVDGTRRLRRAPDWDQTIDGRGVETIVAVLPEVAPRTGDEVDIDGLRYRVLNAIARHDIPTIPEVLPPPATYYALDLDLIGDSPDDPLLPRARGLIERRGGAIERLSASREGPWRHVSIHAEVRWPGHTIDAYGTGENDHRALTDLEESVERLAP